MAIPRHRPVLRGYRVLVCRPQPEAQRLAIKLEAAGASVRILPMLERVVLNETAALRTELQNLDQFHHVIAASPFAARILLERIDTWWPQFPTGLNWYGVGATTAAVFAAAGLAAIAPESGHTSEDLLSLPGLADPAGQRVLLARGDQGRELIRDTLRQRGARVTELALYQRRCPNYSQNDITEALCRFNPDTIITLSGETLNNLIALGQNTDHNLTQRFVVVPGARVAGQAREAGFRNILAPDALDDDAIVSGIARQPDPA